MGEYCTIRDVRLALTPSALETDNETAAKLPDWQIEDAIAEAEGTINAFLLSRYTIPTMEVEEPNPENPLEVWVWIVAASPIRGWTRDIAAWLCALTFRRNKDLPEDDPIRLRYLMVLGFLTAVRDRNMDLPLPGADTGDDQGVTVVNLYDGNLFGLEDFNLGYDGHRQAQRFWPYRADV